MQGSVERLLELFAAQPNDLALLERLDRAAVWIHALPFDVDLARLQNRYYRLLNSLYPVYRERASAGDTEARRWAELFSSVGGNLHVVVD